MMKLVVLPLFLLLMAAPGFTQEKRDTIRSVHQPSVSTAREKRNLLIDSLHLTREQTKKLKNLTREFREELKRVRNNNQLSAEERRKENRDLLKKRQEAIQKILTREQWTRYQQLMANRKNAGADPEDMEGEN